MFLIFVFLCSLRFPLYVFPICFIHYDTCVSGLSILHCFFVFLCMSFLYALFIMIHVSLDCPFLIVSSFSSNVYLQKHSYGALNYFAIQSYDLERT